MDWVEGKEIFVARYAVALSIALFVGDGDAQGVLPAVCGRLVRGQPFLFRHNGELLERIGMGGGGADAEEYLVGRGAADGIYLEGERVASVPALGGEVAIGLEGCRCCAGDEDGEQEESNG